MIEGGYFFIIIGEGYDGSEYWFNYVELILDKEEYCVGDLVVL